jgi:hypothetical protein
LIHADLDEIDAGAGDDAVDETHESLSLHLSRNNAQGPEVCGKLLIDGHITLRSQQPPTSLASLEVSFRTRLSVWLASELANLGISLPCAVNFGPGDLVSNVHACNLSVLDSV